MSSNEKIMNRLKIVKWLTEEKSVSLETNMPRKCPGIFTRILIQVGNIAVSISTSVKTPPSLPGRCRKLIFEMPRSLASTSLGENAYCEKANHFQSLF
jgi:type II secretory pathway component PulC